MTPPVRTEGLSLSGSFWKLLQGHHPPRPLLPVCRRKTAWPTDTTQNTEKHEFALWYQERLFQFREHKMIRCSDSFSLALRRQSGYFPGGKNGRFDASGPNNSFPTLILFRFVSNSCRHFYGCWVLTSVIQVTPQILNLDSGLDFDWAIQNPNQLYCPSLCTQTKNGMFCT